MLRWCFFVFPRVSSEKSSGGITLDKRREKGIIKRERTRRALTAEVREELEAAQSISLKQAMDEFLTAKAAERTAPRTIHDYRRHFRYLLAWLDMKHPGLQLSQITSQ